MPTPDYTRGWSAALTEAARQFDVAEWRAQAMHLRALDREANIAAAYAAEPACRVGGPPPVPGVGWGVKTAAGPWVYAVRSVCLLEGGWFASYKTGDEFEVADHTTATALYLPGAPADAPCWVLK